MINTRGYEGFRESKDEQKGKRGVGTPPPPPPPPKDNNPMSYIMVYYDLLILVAPIPPSFIY
jgi:hypothetical protein